MALDAVAERARKRYNVGVERSTRYSIVAHALADVVERLTELEPTDEIAALRARARQFETEMVLWEEHPPEESTRVELLTRVLDLNVEVIRAGGIRPPPNDDAEPDD